MHGTVFGFQVSTPEPAYLRPILQQSPNVRWIMSVALSQLNSLKTVIRTAKIAAVQASQAWLRIGGYGKIVRCKDHTHPCYAI